MANLIQLPPIPPELISENHPWRDWFNQLRTHLNSMALLSDSTTNAIITIDEPHAQIHDGDTYRYSDSVTLNNGSSQDYLLTTPASPTIHFTLQADGTAITSFFMYEATDKTGTTGQTIYNANRTSANASSMTIKKGTSGGTTDGTLIAQYASGAAQGQSKNPSNVDHSEEWLLKASTKYIFRITSGTAGNLCNVMMSWYEHVSGTNV